MSNARIQFSTASEEKWLQVNPVLREGELVIARKANGKRKLVVGKPGGSSYANSEVVWDAEQAETYMNTTKDLSENVNVFVPHIDSSGILTWTNKAGLDNPSPITIKGIKGDPGEKGEPGQRGEQGAQGIQGPRGIQGEQGERGVQGAQGPAGTAATITIGNVTTSAPGTSAQVTNRGTSSAAVLDFVLPKGKDGADGGVTVDDTLSSTSINPVQNKVIYNALLGKVRNEDIFNGFALRSPTASIMWRIGTQTLGSLTASNYTGTALRATQDGAGNVITDTYTKKADFDKIISELGVAFQQKADKSDLADVATSGKYTDLLNKPTYVVQSVNNIKPDSDGNVSISVKGGGSDITVDTTLSSTSNNPIANKAVYTALNNKLEKNGTAMYASRDSSGNVFGSTYATKTELSKCVKSINNLTPDSSGNVNISTNGGGTNITVDTALSGTSNNAISNKAVYAALSGKLDKIGTAAAATKATQDGAGNVIATTYIKTVNNLKPDASGNVNVSAGGGGVSTSTANTWTAQQDFQHLGVAFERYNSANISGSSVTPNTSMAVYVASGAFTINMATIASRLSYNQATVFSAYITSDADYALTISDAGTVKYIGSASDLAITSAGLLLNILMSKDGTGNLISIIQANKLA